VVALPVLSWWLVGDLSSTAAVGAGDRLSRVVQPPVLGRPAAVAVVVLAAVVVAAALAVLLRRGGALRRRPLWWFVAVPLALTAAAAGAGGRVLTAATVDANIGAGLVVLLGVPLLVLVGVWTVVWSFALGRRRPGADGPL
jgi:hypothetical protein